MCDDKQDSVLKIDMKGTTILSTVLAYLALGRSGVGVGGGVGGGIICYVE